MPRNEPEDLDFEIIYKIEQQGERQLDLALKGVDPLKDTDFYTFLCVTAPKRAVRAQMAELGVQP